MRGRDRDSGAEVLLDLDGQVFVADAKGGYWVRFSVNRVARTEIFIISLTLPLTKPRLQVIEAA